MTWYEILLVIANIIALIFAAYVTRTKRKIYGNSMELLRTLAYARGHEAGVDYALRGLKCDPPKTLPKSLRDFYVD